MGKCDRAIYLLRSPCVVSLSGSRWGPRAGRRGLPSWTACTSAPLSESDWLFRRSDRRRRHRTRPSRRGHRRRRRQWRRRRRCSARGKFPPPGSAAAAVVVVVRPSLLPGPSGPRPKHSGFNGRSSRTRWSEERRGYLWQRMDATDKVCVPQYLLWVSPSPIRASSSWAETIN